MLAAAVVALTTGVVAPDEWVARAPTGHLMYTMDTQFTWNWKALPAVGNGYVSTLITNPAEYVAGVYNWDAPTQSSRATFPATTNIAIDGDAPAGYALDMQRGTAERVFESGTRQRWYAPRAQKHLLVTEFLTDDASLAFTDGAGVRPGNCKHATDEDPGDCYMQLTRTAASTADMDVSTGRIDKEEYPGAPVISFVVVRTSLAAPIRVGGVLRFLSVRVTSLDVDADALEATAVDMYRAAARDASLHSAHVAEWEGLTRAGIFVEGDLDLALSINSSFYGIVSALHKDVPFDTSPGGLATNGYWGNVFWDSDLWVYPNALLFHQDLGRMQMQYRYNVRDGAAKNAAFQGWEGYQFPWQSATTGQETCYNTVYEYDEIHISGDVAQAMWQLYRATHDKALLAEMIYPVVYNVSKFWASRVEKNGDGSYSINRVMCPDEDHDGVNNSVWTNAVAKQTFAWTKAAAGILEVTYPAEWDVIADGLRIPFDESTRYHPEYEGYNGEDVKQADAVLLGYPLMFPMPDDVYLNDLNFYGTHTRNSVAMTYSIFTVGYLSIGRDDLAASAFDKTVRQNNPSGPFHTWGEFEGNWGCPNFQTAAGGFLQSVWAGYGGMRLEDDALTITRPRPPAGGATRLTLSRVKYLGCYVTVDVLSADSFTVAVTECDASAAPLAANGRALHVGQEPLLFSSADAVRVVGRR